MSAGICQKMEASPLIVKFDKPLSKAAFDSWIETAFEKNGPFELWGEPTRLGPTKVHVYGADRCLWQPVNLELTCDGAVAVMPRGAREDTFRRLVENIRLHVCPGTKAWLGAEPFDHVAGSGSAFDKEEPEYER